MSSTPSNRASREGIALIVVLGILSLLVILGFGFSVAMRTERMAASSAAETVRTRQLLQAALARSVDSISQAMIAANVAYPAPTYVSGSIPGPTVLAFGPTNLMSTEALLYVPLDFHVDASNASPRWVNIVDPLSTNVLGRYAFIAVDSSGLIDINSVHLDNMPRLKGTNAGEVKISHLPGFSNFDLFNLYRTNRYIRFESIPDIGTLRNNGLNSYPRNFSTYSRFPPDLQVAAVPGASARKKIDIGGTRSQLQAIETDIKLALTDAGVPNVDEVFRNILDYVDTDVGNVPTDLNSSSSPPVPMVNEIVFFGRFLKQASGTPGQFNYTFQLRMEVELWFPFPALIARTYKLNPDITLAQPSSLPADVAPLYAPLYPVFSPNAGTPVTISVNGAPSADGSFVANQTGMYVVRYDYSFPSLVSGDIPPVFPVAITINAMETRNDADAAVDRVSNLQNEAFVFNANTLNPAAGRGWAITDPRLNHISTEWNFLSGSANLNPGSINVPTRNFTQGEPPFQGTAPTSLGVTNILMYSRRGPMESVAELGFIPIGQRWRTINLYELNGERHRVLDYFTITNKHQVRKGLVNLNTPYPANLGSVFRNAALQDFPGGGPRGSVSGTAGDQIGSTLFNLSNTTLFTNLSEMGRIPVNQFKSLLQSGFPASSPLSDAHIESVIANSMDLVGFRQNLFTIILAAQTIKTSPEGDIVTGEQRAVAVVWRDPFINSNGNYAVIPRFYKLLVD